MVGWHHQLNVHEFEQTLVVGEGQGNLVCCSPWGRKESDRTQQLNNIILNAEMLISPKIKKKATMTALAVFKLYSTVY